MRFGDPGPRQKGRQRESSGAPTANHRKKKREKSAPRERTSEGKAPYQARLCSLNLRLYPAAGGPGASKRRRAAMAAAAGQGGRGGGA